MYVGGKIVMSRFRVGLIGCGVISPMHLESIKRLSGLELVAVCDLKEDRLKKTAEKYDCQGYTDFQELIAQEHPDVVHICTPHYLHAPIAIYAANKGINILTEKPMAITRSDAEEMISAAHRNRVKLGVIFQNRYNPGSLLIKKTLDSGELGRVLSARFSVIWNRGLEYYQKSDWRGKWKTEGGGVLINQAIHTLDLARWFIDSPVSYVESQFSNRCHPGIEVEDTVEGIIFHENNVRTNFYLTTNYGYNVPVEIEIYCEQGIAKMTKDQAVIHLTNGRKYDTSQGKNNNLDYGGGAKNYWGVSHYQQISDYYRALEEDRDPTINGEEGLKTQTLVCAIYQSGKEQKRVYLEECKQQVLIAK